MKTILNLFLFFICLNGFAQENPWKTPPKYMMHNPWLSDEQKKKIIEDEKKREAEEYQCKIDSIKAAYQKEHDAMTERIKASQKKDSALAANASLNQNAVVNTSQVLPKITAEQRLQELRAKKIDIYQLGYNDSKKHYHAEGSGVGAYFLTLIPLIGNPIVWILSASNPGETALADTDHKNKEFLNDTEYSKGYKKAARNTRASKMMGANILGNLTKILIFLTIMN